MMNNQLKEFIGSFDGNKAFEQYMNYWEMYHVETHHNSKVISDELNGQSKIQRFFQFEKSVKVLLDQAKFRLLYVSDNVKDVIGYTAEEIMQYNSAFIFYVLAFEHLSFPLKTAKFGILINNAATAEISKNPQLCVCGVKMKKKDGSLCRVLMKYKGLDFDENNITQTSFITFEDISHLMKSDFYWGRTSFFDEKEKYFHFIGNKKMEVTQDIISDREKDVLHLIAQGLESKEIGNQLFISPGTVDNHRKNMIARTGARDTTALVQLCLSCGII